MRLKFILTNEKQFILTNENSVTSELVGSRGVARPARIEEFVN